MRRRRWSWIWLVPIASLLIGGSLLWTTLARRGPLIQITFDSAEGLQAGQSQVKYKDVQMGTVEGFDLTPDRRRVVMSVRMTAKAEELVTEGAQFWIAKPRVYAGDITGLNTILSGSYIAMQPGEAGKPAQRSFNGLTDPPALLPYAPGRQFHLTASRLGAIKLGTPVFFHDLEVGRVTGWNFGDMADNVTLHVFVSAPYDQWVHRDSRFWNSSGVQVRLGPEGIQLQVDSLKAAVLGGITFDTPAHHDDPKAWQAAESAAGDSFPLFPREDVAASATAPNRAALASYFTGSVGGLGVGAHVTLEGITIGDVTSVDLQYSTETDQTRVRVGFTIQLDRVAPIGNKPVQPFREYVHKLVKEGLRTRLRGGNLITGQKEVEMRLEPDAPPASVEEEGDVQVIPADNSGSGGLDDLSTAATQLIAKIGTIPFAEIGQNLNGTLHGASEVANGSQLRQALTRLNGTLGAVQDTVRRLVVVRGVGLPRYLDREEVVRAAGGVRLRVAQNDWWGEPLRVMLRRVLAADLAQRLPSADVLGDEGPIAARPDAEIELDVQRFDRSPGGPVVFEGYAAITGPGRPRALDRLHVEVPVGADTTAAQVDAMNTALGQVADVIARRLP